MRYGILFAALALAPVWGQQAVRPTPGALGNVTAAPATAAPATAAPAGGTAARIAPTGNKRDTFKSLERDFDYAIKSAQPVAPLDVLGATRGLYVQGYGAVFTTEVDLAWNNYNPMFVRTISNEQKAERHDRKLKNLAVLRKQMQDMMTTMGKSLDLPANEHLTLAVRLLYLGWEDRTGLPDQIVMTANSRGGEVKTDIQ
jgi:hypothetical protein